MRARRIRYALPIVVALALAAGCTKTSIILGQSMSPTLADGERVTLEMALGTIARGDIVAFRYPRDTSKSFVERVIGLPGETLEVANGYVSINGEPLDEPYVLDANRSFDNSTTTVPADAYFVMGDNRRDSSDSRSWGVVDLGSPRGTGLAYAGKATRGTGLAYAGKARPRFTVPAPS